ncbi:MAG: dodecin family protein [Xanthomonadales bacterium]|nr:dodecin family protein [Xanthomonadales bacterium]
MAIAKVTEISSSSSVSFEDAIQNGIVRAARTIRNIESAWVKEQNVEVDGDQVTEWRVHLLITFMLEE